MKCSKKVIKQSNQSKTMTMTTTAEAPSADKRNHSSNVNVSVGASSNHPTDSLIGLLSTPTLTKHSNKRNSNATPCNANNAGVVANRMTIGTSDTSRHRLFVLDAITQAMALVNEVDDQDHSSRGWYSGTSRSNDPDVTGDPHFGDSN